MPSFYTLMIQPAGVGHGLWKAFEQGQVLMGRRSWRTYAAYPVFIASGYGVVWYRRVYQPLKRWWYQ